MGVTIHDYLVANNNELTSILGDKELSYVFLQDTYIDFYQYDCKWWCDIFLDYPLSCNDFATLIKAFADYWWCVCPRFDKRGYKISINIREGLE